MTPLRLRAYVLIVVRDIVIPLGGLALSFLLPLTGQFSAWQLPLLAGMMMVPLVGRGGVEQPERDMRQHPQHDELEE